MENYIMAIACLDKNRGIGKDNDLLFKIPADLKSFKKMTTGNVVVMGRNTFESIGKPLPDRINVVITSKPETLPEGVIGIKNPDMLKEALEGKINKKQDIYIIGGQKIYEHYLPYCHYLYITQVFAEKEADTFFPDYSVDFFRANDFDPQKYEDLTYRAEVFQNTKRSKL